MQLLSVARKYLSDGGGFRLKYTFPALFFQSIDLVERIMHEKKLSAEKIPDSKEGVAPAKESDLPMPISPTKDTDRELVQLFKFMHQLASSIQIKSDDVVLATHLFLTAAKSADFVGMEEVTYEFFVSSLTVYEECINDSRLQFRTLTSIVNALLECKIFSLDNYDTIATKCTLHASRLLKRPDQCRAVIQCSHLFWPQVTIIFISFSVYFIYFWLRLAEGRRSLLHLFHLTPLFLLSCGGFFL
jgi:vacuolar protein sorting-associated protein 35